MIALGQFSLTELVRWVAVKTQQVLWARQGLYHQLVLKSATWHIDLQASPMSWLS